MSTWWVPQTQPLDVSNNVKILINGVLLPYEATCRELTEDLHGEATGRSINTGKLQIQRVRRNLAKLELTWNAVSLEEAHEIHTRLGNNVTFTVEYYSVTEGQRVSKTMYSSNGQSEYIQSQLGIRANVTRNIIEV